MVADIDPLWEVPVGVFYATLVSPLHGDDTHRSNADSTDGDVVEGSQEREDTLGHWRRSRSSSTGL